MQRRAFLKHTLTGIGAAWVGAPISLASLAGPSSPLATDDNEVPGWSFSRWPATGPLRDNPANPRYFTDGSGRAIFLTGAHTWANLQDIGLPPVPRFDWPAYLDMMVKHNHNFMRFWHWMQAAYAPWTDEKILFEPLPYLRPGPGLALDGLPKFDLTKFNPEYFDRMRSRLIDAREHGIYAAVQLFQSFSEKKKDDPCDPWPAHPYNFKNNLSGFNGEEGNSGMVSLYRPEVRAMEAAYLRKVIDTVNDLDNILYEVMNEGGNRDWDWWVVDFVHDYENHKGKRHPIGITGWNSEGLKSMLESHCDWISPGGDDGEYFKSNPPAWDGKKVAVLDTDHLWGHGGTPAWAWKSFCRGYNTLLMDSWVPIPGHPCGEVNWASRAGYPTRDLNRADAWVWEPVRKAIGNTRTYANKMKLVEMTPHDDLASTKFCLASPGHEYLVYLPEGYEVTVDLSTAARKFEVEWILPVEGHVTGGGTVTGGSKVELMVPFPGPATLYLRGV